ncbi:MAG: PHP domain-containing protein [Dehalococcoidales bacterium]|nr:PHP domain-containing protein [Dehalococcoidales bacterium]
MVSRVDLHIHSTASDGRLSPAEIVAKAAGLGLTVIALTDHDTTDGIAPARAAADDFPGLRVIPGVELSADFAQGEVHILGYFIDGTHQELRAGLEAMRNSRSERAREMIVKLDNLGVHIEWPRVQEIAGSGSVGRPHLALAMLEKGYVGSFREAFTNYIGRGAPAYAERRKVTPVEAVELILRAGGLPVLAHPLFINDWRGMVVELKGAGLVGIEAYYNGYTAQEIDSLRVMAEKHGLITTGGSDFHGIDAGIETALGGVDVPVEVVGRMAALAEQRALRVSRSNK